MAEYGVATWDGNGKYNNYGLKPVMVLARVTISEMQTSGQWNFNIRSGYGLRYLQCPTKESFIASRRGFVISGGAITCVPAAPDEYHDNSHPAVEAMIVFYQERL